jgi:hypothetical protein
MAGTTAKLNIKISGANLVKGVDMNTLWTPEEQIEKVINITASTSPVDVPFSDIDNIKEIFIYSDSVFTVTLNDGVATHDIICTKFLIEPDSTYITSLTSIQVSTVSTEEQAIYMNIYGEEEESS